MIKTETHSDMVILSLARSEKRNAMLPEMLDTLEVALYKAGDARAVVLVGEGKTFCAGFDLKACAADASGETMRSLLGGLSRVLVAMRSCAAPVVLGIHGAAIAGGCALLGGADIVIADRDAKLGYPVVKIGVSPAVSSPFMIASIPAGRVRSRLVDPGLIDAVSAVEIGLVHELVDDARDLRPRAVAIADQLASKPGSGCRETKRWLNAIVQNHTDRAEEGLATSLKLTGGEEERAMLGALWS